MLDMLFLRFYAGDVLYLALEKNTENEELREYFKSKKWDGRNYITTTFASLFYKLYYVR